MEKVSTNAQTCFETVSNSCKLFCFGGGDESNELTVSCMNVSTGEWKSLTPLLVPNYYFSGAMLDSKFYVGVGGDNDDVLYMKVFDCKTNTWTELTQMPQPLARSAAEPLNGFIYVTGGYIYIPDHIGNTEQYESSVFRYNIQTNVWQRVKEMKRARMKHQLVELNGSLYAIGGFQDYTMEQYNPTTDQWTMVASMHYTHCEFGACSFEGKIYVCSEKAFEVYCPNSNTWTILTPLNQFYGRTLVPVNGKLWAIGGCHYEWHFENPQWRTKSIFEYDKSTEQWTQLPDMDVPRRNHFSFVINL